MKQFTLFITLVVLLLSGTSLVSAQEGCEINVEPVKIMLDLAQSYADSGDMDSALATLAEIQTQLQDWENACTSPSEATSGQIAVFVYESNYGDTYYLHSFTKLSGLAFANGLDLVVYEDPTAFFNALAQPDVAAAIYGGNGSATDLVTLRDFVERGGRALLLYNTLWLQQDTALQDTFGIALAEEASISRSTQGILYNPLLPSWLAEFNVGIAAENAPEVSIHAYLIAPGADGERGYLTSEITGNDRLLYYSSPDRAVTLFPAAQTFQMEHYYEYFFDDAHIDYFDNEAAALLLLNYLLGR